MVARNQLRSLQTPCPGGPGYRLYYMRAGEAVYLMLGGGDKSTQAADIKRATGMATELKATAKASKPRKPK